MGVSKRATAFPANTVRRVQAKSPTKGLENGIDLERSKIMGEESGEVVAVSISAEKGVPKVNVVSAQLMADWGLERDAHAGTWSRQVSLLALESIEKMRARGVLVSPGNFAENITTQGLDLVRLKVGGRLHIGEAELEITQIGKVCHTRCAIYKQVGDCVMPREGVFARVVTGGHIQPGDTISVVLPQ